MPAEAYVGDHEVRKSMGVDSDAFFFASFFWASKRKKRSTLKEIAGATSHLSLNNWCKPNGTSATWKEPGLFMAAVVEKEALETSGSD